MATAFSKDNVKSKLGWSNSFNRDGAFPLDINQYFGSYADAEAAAATAKDFGSTESVYYYGMEVFVFDGDSCTAYLIQGDGTLLEVGAGNASTALASANTYTDNAINALDKSDTAVSGQYVSAVSETNGIITVTRASLPDYSTTYDAYGAADTAEANAATYTDNAIAALDYEEISISDGDGISFVSSIEQTDGIIAPTYSTIRDLEDTAVSGQYVSAVSQTNGEISVTRASLPDYSTTYDAYGSANTAYSDAVTYVDTALTWESF